MQSVTFVTKIICISTINYLFPTDQSAFFKYENKRLSTERIQSKFCWPGLVWGGINSINSIVTILTWYLLRQHSFQCLVCYFEKNLNVRWSKITTSCEKSTVFTRITRGVFVRLAAFSIRVLIIYSVVIYEDVTSPTKNGSVGGTSVHCVLLVLVLYQLHRIVSFDVVKRENKSFAGWRISTGT